MRRFFLHLLLLSVLPLVACGGKFLPSSSASLSPKELEGKKWEAVSIYGKAVEKFPDQDSPHLLFFEVQSVAEGTNGEGATARVAGSDGCNRLIGSAQFTGNALTFPPMGSTMMACPFGFEQSTAFKKALAETTARRMADGNLEMLAGDASVLVLKPVAAE